MSRAFACLESATYLFVLADGKIVTWYSLDFNGTALFFRSTIEFLDNVPLRNRVFTTWHRPVVWSPSKVTRMHANGCENVVRWARAKDHTPCDIQMNTTYDRQSRCHKRRFAVSLARLLIPVELVQDTRVIFMVYTKQTGVIGGIISVGFTVN